MLVRTLWACLASLALAAGAQGQGYPIKLKRHPDESKSITRQSVEKTTGSVRVLGPGQNLLNEDKLNRSSEEVFTETVLEKGARHPKKLRRTYTTATRGGKPASYQGRTVVFELRDGQYQVSGQGKPELPARDLEKLAGKANDNLNNNVDEALLPKKPVKVGETWDVDKKVIEKAFGKGGEIDSARTVARGKLVRVYRKGGRQFGVLEFNLKLAIKNMQGLAFDRPATFDVKGTLDTAIDGSTTAGTMTLEGAIRGTTQLDQGGMKLTIEMAVDISSREDRSAEK